MENMNTDAIKSCPFCSGEARLQRWRKRSDYYVICKKCGCRTPLFQYQFDSKEKRKKEAIAAWNTRKPIERIVEQMEILDDLTLDQYNKSQAGTYEHDFADGKSYGIELAIDIVKEEGGLK